MVLRKFPGRSDKEKEMDLVRDVEKSNIRHEKNDRRSRRRKRGRSVIVFLVIVLAAAVIVTLSMTVFFNIKTIRVTGNADNYNAEDVVRATGISVGDNMMRLHIEEAEQQAIDSLIHVESVKIVRQFPDTLEIQVQKCTPAYNVVYEYGTLIVSEHGRILEDSMDPRQGLVRIVGYKPKETTPGKYIEAEQKRYDRVFTAFRELIYAGGLTTPITEVDMSDFNDIMVNFDHRIIFDMGNWSEINYKISFAEQIISEQPADKEGYLIMVGTNQCAFRNKADYETTRKRARDAAKASRSETTELPDGEDEPLPEDDAADEETESADREEPDDAAEDDASPDGIGNLDDVYGEE